MLAPAGTPPAIVAKLSEALVKALNQADVRERFLTQGLDAAPLDSPQFAAFLQSRSAEVGGNREGGKHQGRAVSVQ